MRKALFLLLLATCGMTAQASDLTIKIKNRYLNFPISHQSERQLLTFQCKGVEDMTVKVRLAQGEPEYWVFKDMNAYRGKTVTLHYDGPQEALERIQQADTIVGQKGLYGEKNRPQFHFTSRRGWINDPNGLVYHNGLYHLYYQHNPFERDWENMTWGHATSKDLVHWQEHGDVLFPDSLGTMFSGSAVVDSFNTSGFGTKRNPPIVYAYTVDRHDRQAQCMAYSLDGGMTLQKYAGNPVINSKAKWDSQDTRDPRLLWYAPGKHWVLVLNERDGHSIYTSTDMKQWTYQSHVTGFWECPDLFELPVDGDPSNTRWVMYGASNTYMIGRFDGKTFTPEAGKYRFSTGTIYAAQTISNVPDGRRIQIGWGRVGHPGMPFNGQMLLPTQLQLRQTVEGIRLVSTPVAEVQSLLHKLIEVKHPQDAELVNRTLAMCNPVDILHLRGTLHLNHRTSAGIALNGQNIVDYDSNHNTLNGQFYCPQDPTSMDLTVDVYIDRTSVEVFVDGGLFSYSLERRLSDNQEGIRFWGTKLRVSDLCVDRMDGIW